MDKAKAAVSNILSKSGHHDTTVHESVAPSVHKERINEHHREEKQIARDREVHQDHYHTSVQPVHDQQVLPEQHHHKQVGIEHTTHDHRDHGHTKERLQQEAAQFKNESVRAPTAHKTSTTVPDVTGEHVHHHVHEKIQSVVHRETIEPHVVHTTVPVHETHHNAAQHHTTSELPAVHMSEFTKHGGSLTGRGEQVDRFDGEPRNIEHAIGSGHNAQQHTGAHSTNTGLTGTGTGTGVGHTGHHHSTGTTGTTGTTGNAATDAARHATGTHDSSHSKPSLMDKLNPKKDSDGDGKAGFMS